MVDSLTIYYSVLQGNSKTNLWVLPIGIVWFCLYYIIFRFLIIKFNFKTPDVKIKNKLKVLKLRNVSDTIIKGLGGATNIEEVDCCATRLRVTLKDGSLLSKDTLMTTDAKGVIIRGNGAQIVYGPHVTTIKNEVEEVLEQKS